MNQINVDIKQANIKYKILFSNDIFSSIKENIKDYEKKKFLFVVDYNVYDLYKEKISYECKLLNADFLVLSSWERNKTIKTVFKIIDKLMESWFTRKDYVISIWGWVTWDITAFACSLFKRWINFVQVPTTLLSMCDSSVWWKTGVDYMSVKNWVGTFYNPSMVLVDINYLKTLPKRELLSWYFEWIKHAIMLGKKDYLEYVEIYDKLINKKFGKEIEKVISKNIKCKLLVVKSDPTETIWKRRVLNYGHTFGHALETYLKFKLWHGICVGFWIIYANLLWEKLWFLKKESYKEIEKFIKSVLANIKIDSETSSEWQCLDFEEIYRYMKNDKKNENQLVNFILLKDFWEVFEYKVDKKELKEVFEKFCDVVSWANIE